MKMKHIKTEAATVKVGSTIQAHHYQSGQWRPAKVLSLTPYNDNVGAGYYVQWLDVDANNLAQSQTAWVTEACIRG